MRHSRSGECFSVSGKNKLTIAIEGIPKYPHILNKSVCVCVYYECWMKNRCDDHTFAQWVTINRIFKISLLCFSFLGNIEMTIIRVKESYCVSSKGGI